MVKYFIAKHDLESFTVMPGFIWRTDLPKGRIPINFRNVEVGDRWVEFAYRKGWDDREQCSKITGFYECTKPRWYGPIPVDKMRRSDSLGIGRFESMKKEVEGCNAHMIQGKPFGDQPRHPVTVPSINDLLGKTVVGPTTVVRIDRKEFEHIRKEVEKRYLDPGKIPLFGRELLNETELLSLVAADVACGDNKLGIEEIIHAQTHFPDMLVRINGKEVYLELEFDSRGFWDHVEKKQLRRASRGGSRFEAKVANDKDDNTPVACLCWVDGDKQYGGPLKDRVRGLKVFEVQSLLRSGKPIPWP